MKNNFPLLDFFRIFTASLMAVILGNEAFTNFPLYPESFWQPQGALQLFDLKQISVETVQFFLVIFWMATICALLGLFTRTSLIVVGLTTTFLYSLKMSFGYMNHRESALILTFFILSAYPTAGRFSLDAYFFKKRQQASAQETFGFLLCLRVLLCIVYFSAGASKLIQSGLDWMTTPTLQYYLQFCDVTIAKNWAQFFWPHAGYHLASNVQLTYVLATLVVLLELATPFAFFRRLRVPIIGGLMILQLSTILFLKISFIHLTPLYLAWLPWEKWLHLTKAATK